MLDEEIPIYNIRGVNFSVYSADDIKSLSVKEVVNPQSFDFLGHPTFGGLYDPAFGPASRDEMCTTCGMGQAQCPGHMGHIQLPVPVFNPVLFKMFVQLLKGTCFKCHRFLSTGALMSVFKGQIQLLDYGLTDKADDVFEAYHSVVVEQGGAKGVDEEVEDRIQEIISNALSSTDDIESAKQRSNVKNVVAARQMLIKEFLRGQFFVKGRCPQCDMPVRPLKSEHNCRIYFYKGISRKQALNILNKEQEKKQQEAPVNADEEEETPMECDIEVVRGKKKKEIEVDEAKVEKLMANQEYLMPTVIKEHVHKLWQFESDTLQKVFGILNMKCLPGKFATDIFFIDVLPVIPTRYRPTSVLNGRHFDNPQTANLCRVIEDTILIRDVMTLMSREVHSTTTTNPLDRENVEKAIEALPGNSMTERLYNVWIRMQKHVNVVMDSDLDKLSTDKQPGIKQILEKKEGLFRKHMMGKRVNYAARSVISPDPYIATNEIGIPDVFAIKLTYPQPVTPWNFHELKQAILNGPKVHPGATHVVFENGKTVTLHPHNLVQREAVAKQLLTPVASSNSYMSRNKVVHRHLKDGDILLLNRQPTLHRPSIQGHKARILPNERTLRLHYANCKAYNADFDGDEMNAHFPQDEISRAEAHTIVSTDYQYLVPKDGSPLAGLIQDHMISGVLLTMRGRHFCRGDYHQLVYSALTDVPGHVKLVPPAIMKPQILWSGKQVLSTILLNLVPTDKPALNLLGSAKISLKQWNNSVKRSWTAGGALHGDEMSETEVVIRGGELLVGVLDKGHYGPTKYGLVHSCYELYGGPVAGKLLSCLARLFTYFLQLHGFTLGVEDILCTKKANEQRQKIMKEGRESGHAVATVALNMEHSATPEEVQAKLQNEHFSSDAGSLKDLDLCMKGNTDEIQNNIAKACMPEGLLKLFPHNNLQLMVQSGAKGSSVNCMQISCLLGQIELEGRRPPLMMSGQFLPSFLPYDTSPRAGGFVDGRFLTGIRPQEYFFHCMAGREGLIDTAVKTSRSGYLQRCIIKHLEGLTVNYDLTVRDSDGSIIQFQYGEDALEIPKTQYLTEEQLPFLISNQQVLRSGDQIAKITSVLDTEKAPKLSKKIRKWNKKHEKGKRISGFLHFCEKNWNCILDQNSPTVIGKDGRSKAARYILDWWRELTEERRNKYITHNGPCPDPVVMQITPHRHFGSITEKLDELIESYITNNPHQLIKKDDEMVVSTDEIKESDFRDLMYMQSLKSLVHPGEAVGLIAAQSIGEPSTQMTLNTFHFAGRGEMNVTLGIPRLREILIVASRNIKTPSMDIPILDTPEARQEAKTLRMKLTKVLLSQVLKSVQVRERVQVKGKRNICQNYYIRFNFLPYEIYKDEYYVTPARILRYFERKFARQVADTISKTLKEHKVASIVGVSQIRIPKATPTEEGMQDDEMDEDFDQHDGDATVKKAMERATEDLEYVGEDEEKKELEGDEEEEEEEEEADEEEESGEALDGDSESGDNLERKEKNDGQDFDNDNSKLASPEMVLTSPRLSRKRKHMDENRVRMVMKRIGSCVNYKYDADEELWCEIQLEFVVGKNKVDITSLIFHEAKCAVIYQTPGISRAFLAESKVPGEEGILRLKTEGVNIWAMTKYARILNLDKLYCNDIHQVATMYGIEAASRVLVKEICDVFAGYGIRVDYRHLSLIADYMTFEGVYKPFNRKTLESNASPLQKMTFETTMTFLKTATFTGAKDELKSPSSRLVVGGLVGSGTGAFDLLQPLIPAQT